MEIIEVENYDELSKVTADLIENQIKIKRDSVLGLATGSSPVGTYKELIKRNLDFSEVRTINLDEYRGLHPDNKQSYMYFMRDNLFNHINIRPQNIHIPNGMTSDIEFECEKYDKDIKTSGGIDIQVLGIGHNAHIGFNEPTISFEKGTHLVDLKESTIEANARFFDSIDKVPKKALTMGTGSIFKAKKIMLLASGEGKAEAIYNTVHGKVTPEVPASILQFHNDIVLILDEAAASKLNKEDYKLA
jgi:glucosamine-6-phosphate deaminase